MDQRFSLDRTSFERFLSTASLLQQLQKRTISSDSHVEDLAPELTDLSDTQQAIQTGALSVDAALLRISALALKLIPAQGAGVWLFSGDRLLYRAGTGTASSDESLCSAISANLASSSTGVHPDDDEAFRLPQVRSLVLAPIYQGQKIAGGLAVFSEKTDCFKDRDEASARLLSGLAAQALDKAANARFKQTVTLEREAVLHVIGALVPSLKDLVEATPDNEQEAAHSVHSAAPEINNTPVWSALDFPDLLITAHNFPNQAKTEKAQNSSVLRTEETTTPTEGASSAMPTERGPLSSSPPSFEEWAAAAGMSDIRVTQRPEHAATRREVESALIQESVGAPATAESESTGFVTEILAAARHVRNRVSALHVQTTIAVWFQLRRSSFARMANLAAASLNDSVVPTLKRIFQAGRLIPRRRLITATGLILVATVLAVKIGVSKFRVRSAKTASPVSRVDNVKPNQTLIVDGSHKRVTDEATSVALAELSHFEIPGLLRQARFGDDSAAFLIGMAYETGRGVPQNCEKAARWVREAATGGYAAAEYNLSLRYRDGDGVLADSEQSEKWLQKAAAHKYPQALAPAALQTN